MVEIGYKTINHHQDEIIDAFATFLDDRTAMLDYLIDLGTTLAPMEPLYKVDDYLVPGCMSKVWLADIVVNELFFLQADSNTVITKGLVSLLVKVLSGQSMAAIVVAKLYFVEAIGMNELIGFQRASGFEQMVKQIKFTALARLNK